jgi:tetratricopeptide (TPR) repeat protein
LLGIATALGVFLALGVASFRPPAAGKKTPHLAVFADPKEIQELLTISEEQPRDPEWQLRLGDALLRQTHYLSAAVAFRKARSLGAPATPVLWGLVGCAEGLDDDDEAVLRLQELRSADPANLSVPLRMAAAEARLGRRREALSLLDAIPRDAAGRPTLRDPGGPAAGLERLGVAYGLQGSWAKSLACAEALLRDHSRGSGAHAIAGQALLSLGRAGEAVDHFRSALAQEPGRLDLQLSLARSLQIANGPRSDADALKLLEPIVQTGKAPAEVLYRLAAIHERRRNWSWAASYYAAAARAGVGDPALERHACENLDRAGKPEQALYLRGRQAEMQGRLDVAAAAYRELIRLRPKADAGYRHVARVLLAKNDPAGAVKTLERASRLPSPNPRVFMRLALAYQASGDHSRETQAWGEFEKRQPTETYLFHASAASKADSQGRLDDAEAELRKCVELQPKIMHYRIRLAQLLIERRDDHRRVSEARNLLEEALPSSREDVEVHLTLGSAYRYSGMLREAIWAMRHAIDLDPGNGRPYQMLGETLMEAGEREEGQQMLALFKRYRSYKQAVDVLTLRSKRNPRDADVARRLGALQLKSGAYEDARATYSRVLSLDPTADWARKRLAFVQKKLAGEDTEADEAAPPPRGE